MQKRPSPPICPNTSTPSNPPIAMRQLILLLALLIGSAFAAAADGLLFHCLQKTLIPGTVYYFPDGRASADSAWNSIGPFGKAPTHFSLYALLDSTTGYDSPCSLRIEAIYSLDGYASGKRITGDTLRIDTTAFFGYPTTTVVFNQPFYTVPEDSGRLISAPVYLHDKMRWRVTVSDTCALSLIEKIGKP